jgi:hypothetical protein
MLGVTFQLSTFFNFNFLGSHNASNLNSANTYVNKNTVDNLVKGQADVNR